MTPEEPKVGLSGLPVTPPPAQTGNTTSTSTTTKSTLIGNDQLKVPDLNKNFSLFKAPAASLDKAQNYYNSVMKGKDFTTQRMTNQFMEANAAQSAAAKGSAAQQAALTGATANSQALLNRMTARDVEGQRQQGMNELSATLGQRGDQAAGQLAQIGEYKSNYEMQAKQNENQAKQNEAMLGINLKELEMKMDQTQKGQDYEAFKIVMETADLTTANGMNKAIEAAKKVGIDLDLEALKMKQWDLKEDKANKELMTHINTNISNYKLPSGSYDPSMALKDPKVQDMLLDLWDAEYNGTAGDLIPKDANGKPDWSQMDEADKKWVNDKLKSAMITDKEQAANDFVASMNVFKTTPNYLNMSQKQKEDFDKSLADISAMMMTGLDVKIENGQVVIKDPATGTVIGAGSVWDKNEGKYVAVGDKVSLTNKDGSIVDFSKDADGNWLSNVTVNKVIPLETAGLSALEAGENGKRYGYYTKKDPNTIVYEPRGGKPVEYKKGADGKWVNTTVETKPVTDEQKSYINQATGVKKQGDTSAIGIKIPSGVQSGQGFSSGNNWFVNDSGVAVPLSFNDPKPEQMNAILGLSGDAKALPYVVTAIKNTTAPMTSAQKVQVGELVKSGKIDTKGMSAKAMDNAGIGTLKMGGPQVFSQGARFNENTTPGSAVIIDGEVFIYEDGGPAFEAEAQAMGYDKVAPDMTVYRLVDKNGNVRKVFLNKEKTAKMGW